MATKGTVSGVIANMVTLVVDGPVAQNEICYISTGGDKLMAEVIKVVGTQVYVQVFESTRGLKVGAEAEFTGHMLEVTLGPGMLSKNYDGLQNDLDKMDGVFLKRGQYTYPLDKGSKWHFVPLAKVGDQVEAAAWLGQVDENFQPLKIMVPFEQKGVCTVKSIAKEGDYSIEDTIAVLTDGEGNDIRVNMIQKWPVKRAMTNYKGNRCARNRYREPDCGRWYGLYPRSVRYRKDGTTACHLKTGGSGHRNHCCLR